MAPAGWRGGWMKGASAQYMFAFYATVISKLSDLATGC